MKDTHREYLAQALRCHEMAEISTTDELKAEWLHLSARWLAMIPPDRAGHKLSPNYDAPVRNRAGEGDSTPN